MSYYFTSESVTEGHPDKICDQISDYILDEALRQDKNSHMAVEATIKDDFILIYGEAKTKAILDYESLAKRVLKDIGYVENFNVLVKVSKQSAEINNSVEKETICAGDQGIMFGYATDETEELMPLSITLANQLAQRLAYVRKNKIIPYLLPDGKTQVTVKYVENSSMIVDKVIIACQHQENILYEKIVSDVKKYVIEPVIDKKYITENTKYMINTSGSFVLGGPFADSGTTGRKIVCDTYGGVGRIGGGCFSSKDPSKVDRSAAYYARYVSKNIVHYGLAKKCEIQVSYAIGHSKPESIYIETYNTNTVNVENIYQFVEKYFDFSVGNIIKELGLLRPIYYKTASYGHFGRKIFPWEQIKNVENFGINNK